MILYYLHVKIIIMIFSIMIILYSKINLFLIKEIKDLEENRPGRSKKCSNRIQHQTGFVNIGIVTKKSRFKKLTNTKLFVKNIQKRSEYITIYGKQQNILKPDQV